jgi:hypothetical protein
VPLAAVGRDVDALALVTTAAMLAFLVAWYAFARARLARPLPLLGIALLGLSPLYVLWTDVLGSEPAFMAAVFGTFVWLDHCRHRWTTAWTAPALAGLAVAVCFSIRREGVALLPAIAVAQALALGVRGSGRRLRERHVVANLVAPYAAFAAAVGLLQLVLPSTLVPRYEGTGVANIVRFRGTYVHAVATAFGSASATVGWCVVVLGAAGLLYAARARPPVDGPILTYAVVVTLIGGSFHVPSDRYIATVIPLLLYGMLQLPSVAVTAFGPSSQRLVAAATIAVLAIALWSAGTSVADLARHASDAGERPVDGPQARTAVEMFAAVERLTGADDVIGFSKARAMTFETDRRAVQVGGDRPPLTAPIDFDALVLFRSDPSAAAVASNDARFELLWANPDFLLFAYRPPT